MEETLKAVLTKVGHKEHKDTVIAEAKNAVEFAKETLRIRTEQGVADLTAEQI